MSCDNQSACGCGPAEVSSQTKCWTLNKCSKKRSRQRLNALKMCEPYCAGGACSVNCTPQYADGKISGMKVGRVVLPDETNCAVFGPHWGSTRRDSSLSPIDVEKVMDAYSKEEEVTIFLVPHPSQPGYWIGSLGALLVSHVFQVLSFRADVVSPVGGPSFVPKRFGVAGDLLACSNSEIAGENPPFLVDQRGSYKKHIRRACYSEDGFEITEYKCRCVAPPGSVTPAHGREWFVLETPDGLVIPPLGGVRLVVHIRRGDWLLNPQRDVCTPAGRLPHKAFDNYKFNGQDVVLPLPRVVAGAIVTLP